MTLRYFPHLFSLCAHERKKSPGGCCMLVRYHPLSTQCTTCPITLENTDGLRKCTESLTQSRQKNICMWHATPIHYFPVGSSPAGSVRIFNNRSYIHFLYPIGLLKVALGRTVVRPCEFSSLHGGRQQCLQNREPSNKFHTRF